LPDLHTHPHPPNHKVIVKSAPIMFVLGVVCLHKCGTVCQEPEQLDPLVTCSRVEWYRSGASKRGCPPWTAFGSLVPVLLESLFCTTRDVALPCFCLAGLHFVVFPVILFCYLSVLRAPRLINDVQINQGGNKEERCVGVNENGDVTPSLGDGFRTFRDNVVASYFKCQNVQ
jgi:hypothetical protein